MGQHKSVNMKEGEDLTNQLVKREENRTHEHTLIT